MAQTWQLHSEWPYRSLFYSHDKHCPIVYVTSGISPKHVNHTKHVRATPVCMSRGGIHTQFLSYFHPYHS